MWLPMDHTFKRNDTYKAVDAGKYDHFRLFNVIKREPLTPMYTVPRVHNSNWVKPVVQHDGEKVPQAVNGFHSTCWYFGQYLDSMLGGNIPIGLIASAIGGSTIEQWTDHATLQGACKDLDLGAGGVLFNGMTVPFVNMTIRQVLWYQGENNAKECCDPDAPAGRVHCENLPSDDTLEKTFLDAMHMDKNDEVLEEVKHLAD
eukprot:UN31765